MSPFALDSLLRVLWSVLVPRSGGALVHACGLRHAELGVVFPGVSGVGKTTLARKAPDADDVLSDEMMVLRPVSDGGWRVYGTPFWGDFARGGISMRSWPLRCIGFLEQAPSRGDDAGDLLGGDAAPAGLLRLLPDRRPHRRAQPGGRRQAVR